tara:strand:+ start:22553 stop:22999 length:447 start_codon:yes stop_codon:yes gene_type:complete
MITTLDELHDEWEKDGDVDKTEIGDELLKIPRLHAKYLRILSYHNSQSKELGINYTKAKKIRYEYYQGDLNNPDDLAKYGFDPMVKRILKTEIPLYIESDATLLSIIRKKNMHDEIASATNSILKELNSRTYQLRSYIDYEKFINGSN